MFNTLLAIFIGGGAGSVLRWLISLRFNTLSTNLPVGTLLVNLIGAFIIGLAMALFIRMTHIDSPYKLLITAGFCGGFTTFSTFSIEVIYLLQDGKFAWAVTNILLNLLGSLIMTFLAFTLINTLNNH